MILSDSRILKAIESGEIIIDPFKRENLGPNSYDVTLGNTLRCYENFAQLDCKKDNPTYSFEMPESGFVLYPHTLYLGHTVEKVTSSVYAPYLDGKSSTGRLGIGNHVTAGGGDVGFDGDSWTLEITVVYSTIVYPYMPIGQIKFFEVAGEVITPYNKNPKSKYNKDNKAKSSQMFKNFLK